MAALSLARAPAWTVTARPARAGVDGVPDGCERSIGSDV
jgi:hypothetical protein